MLEADERLPVEDASANVGELKEGCRNHGVIVARNARARTIASHGPRPHLSRPGRLPSGQQRALIRRRDVEVFALSQRSSLLRQLLAHVIGFSAELADHHLVHLQLATTAAGKVHPLSIVFEEGSALEVA